MNSYYNHGGVPATGAAGASATMRAEFDAIASGFALLPTLSGFGNKAVVVNAGGTALTATLGSLALGGDLTVSGASALTFTTTGVTNVTFPTTGLLATTSNHLGAFAVTTSSQLAGVISDETGSGALVFATSPTLVTPILGTPTSGTLTNCTGLPVAGVIGAVPSAGGNLTGGLNEAKTTVASATTPDIFALTVGNYVDYTGTVSCTGFAAAPAAGAMRELRCAGAAPFVAGANMLIDGYASGETFTATADDRVIVRAETTTQFRLTIRKRNAKSINASLPFVVAGGTADAITANFTPDLVLADQPIFALVMGAANATTTPTLAVDGGTARTIVKKGGSALLAGDIPGALAVCIFKYNLANTRFELLNPAATVSGTLTAGTTNTKNPVVFSTQTTAAHGLGATPTHYNKYLECITTEWGYAVGDRIDMPGQDANGAYGISVSANATNTYISIAGGIVVVPLAGGSPQAITAANWKAVVVPYKIA